MIYKSARRPPPLGRFIMRGDPVAKLTMLRPSIATLKPKAAYLDTRRGRDVMQDWRRLYKTARWQRLRMSILERDLFTCQWPGCGRMHSDTSQLVADHKRAHRGDLNLFWDAGNLQCLCKSCHDREKQREEAASRRGWGG